MNHWYDVLLAVLLVVASLVVAFLTLFAAGCLGYTLTGSFVGGLGFVFVLIAGYLYGIVRFTS